MRKKRVQIYEVIASLFFFTLHTGYVQFSPQKTLTLAIKV